MARTAIGKLDEADELDKKAKAIGKMGDTVSERELKELARGKRRTAIKQLKRKPRRRTAAGGVRFG